ncbi:hypothetical protein [Bacillus benzoevorans]|uniref:Flagellar hook-length control protein FliK n=1 Tax=Bacillus benzoevorans TaxID=1456 RepID=A0A7X0HQQ7_9BACI|nr:hypothetical protein [Bacillus benzoevorans]MBB6443826.1 hypothetical protein [Bacillus benzoevorans]
MKPLFLNHILHEGNTPQIKALSFRPGQVFTGKIIKLFPDNLAALQIGAQKIIAQLEAPLEAGKPYWFQVMPGDGKPRLKVLVNATENLRANPHDALLKQLSLPQTAENQSLIRFLLKEQLPIHKEIFQLAGDLQALSLKSAETEAVKLLLNKGLPLTKTSFQAVLSALNNESLSKSIETLRSLLETHTYTEEGEKLLRFLQNLFGKVSDDPVLPGVQMNREDLSGSFPVQSGQTLSDRPVFVQYLKEMMQQMGLAYEQELVHVLKSPQEGQEISRESLKPLLIDYLMGSPAGPVQEAAENVLNKITGIQLLGTESGPIQQFALQLPIMLGQKMVDLTMQWSGKRQENGQIDPAYCRILFYIELQYLQETIVDMQVQNRIIRLRVINEHEQLKHLAAPFIEGLKENLETLNFTLSAVQFTRQAEDEIKTAAKQHGAAIFDQGYYSGVDIRI